MDAHLDRYHDRVRRLVGVALARLPSMIDPATGLVVHHLQGDDLTPRGTSLRYTAMTALGLARAAEHGLACDVDLERIDDAIDATLAGAATSGDLGLVLWATASRDLRIAERALYELGEFGDVARTRRGSMVHSTELAWVVIGLAEALACDVGTPRDVRARLDRAFAWLLDQRGASGLVCFARPLTGRVSGPRAWLMSELGFFDAQVYTILACLKRDAVVPDLAARDAARAIAERLLHHQRTLGQWAWHYNARTGEVVDVYPVYAVHQDGMAPMALLPLERALSVPTTAAVARGVAWLFGENELSVPVVDEDRAIVWRSIRRKHRGLSVPLKAASLCRVGRRLDLGARMSSPSALTIDREVRPYHLAFCLLAFSEIAAHRGSDEPCSDPRPTLRTGAFSASSRAARASNST
jgi:hypothetical protein